MTDVNAHKTHKPAHAKKNPFISLKVRVCVHLAGAELKSWKNLSREGNEGNRAETEIIITRMTGLKERHARSHKL